MALSCSGATTTCSQQCASRQYAQYLAQRRLNPEPLVVRTCWTTSTVLTVKSVSKDVIEIVSIAMWPFQGTAVRCLRCSHTEVRHAECHSAATASLRASLISGWSFKP